MSGSPGFRIDAVTGDVELPIDLTVGTSLTRSSFEDTPPAENARSRGAAPNWLHRSFTGGEVDGHPLLSTLTFQGERLISAAFTVSLYPPEANDWDSHSLDVERRTKDIHDALLTDCLGAPNRRALAAGIAEPSLARTLVWEFPWGRVLSCYDSRSGGTSIRVLYV